jgi:hypothetical protein
MQRARLALAVSLSVVSAATASAVAATTSASADPGAVVAVAPATGIDLPSETCPGGYSISPNFTEAEGTWHAPYTLTSSQAPGFPTEAMWVGIGDGSAESSPLVQAGTWNDLFAPNGRQRLWWEVFCSCEGGNSAQFLGSVRPGALVSVAVSASGTTDTLNISTVNPGASVGSGMIITYHQLTESFVGGAAEWISERPLETDFSSDPDGYLDPLAKTAYPSTGTGNLVTGARARASAGSSLLPIGYFAHTRYNMVPCNPDSTIELQHTSTLDSTGASFQTKWENYGRAETYTSCQH